jgi:hypothetical protein
MSQANDQNSTSPSRRGVLTALAGASLIAIPTAAIAVTESSENEFAILGARLEQQWRAYALNRPLYEAAWNRSNELFYQRLIKEPRSPVSFGPHHKAALAEAGVGEPEKVDEDTWDAVVETIKQIDRMQPASLADLAALANVCAITSHELWAEPLEDIEWEVRHFRALVEAVLRLAGKTLVLEGLPTPQVIDQDAYERAKDIWAGAGLTGTV